MQRILYFTRQPGSRAFLSASSSTSLFNSQSTRHSTPSAPRRVRGSTASSPLPIDDDTKSGDPDDSCKLLQCVELTEQLDCKSMEIKWYKYMKVDRVGERVKG